MDSWESDGFPPAKLSGLRGTGWYLDRVHIRFLRRWHAKQHKLQRTPKAGMDR